MGRRGKGRSSTFFPTGLRWWRAMQAVTTPGIPSLSEGRSLFCSWSVRGFASGLPCSHWNGVVLDPLAFLKEIGKLRDLGSTSMNSFLSRIVPR